MSIFFLSFLLLLRNVGGLLLRWIVFRVAHESSKAIKAYLGGGEKKK